MSNPRNVYHSKTFDSYSTSILVLVLNILMVIQVQPWCLLDKFDQGGQKVWTVSYSPNCTMYAVGLDNKSIIIYDAADQSELKHFSSGFERANTLEFSPDGQFLAVGYNPALKIIDIANSYNVITVNTQNVNDIAWQENSNKLAACEQTNHVRVYDTSGWNSPLASPVGTPITYNVGYPIRTCVFIPGTTDLMVGTSNYKTHKIPDPYISKTLSNTFSDMVNDLDFRKGSTNYIVGLEDFKWYYSTDFTSSTNFGDKVFSVEYSPTNQFYSIAGDSGYLKIFNSLNEENTLNVSYIASGGKPFFDASFSADGEYLIVGSED